MSEITAKFKYEIGDILRHKLGRPSLKLEMRSACLVVVKGVLTGENETCNVYWCRVVVSDEKLRTTVMSTDLQRYSEIELEPFPEESEEA